MVSTESLPAVFGLLSLTRVHRVFGGDVVYAGQFRWVGHAVVAVSIVLAGAVRLWVVLAITLRNLYSWAWLSR